MSWLQKIRDAFSLGTASKTSRRAFLQGAVAATAAVVVAPEALAQGLARPTLSDTALLVPKTFGVPLYIPGPHLEYGVPTGRLALPPSYERALDQAMAEALDAEVGALFTEPTPTWEEWQTEEIAQAQAPARDPRVAGPPQGRQIQMRLIADTYHPLFGGELKTGDTINVDERTAMRWTEWHVAAPVTPSLEEVQRVFQAKQRYEERPGGYRPYHAGSDEFGEFGQFGESGFERATRHAYQATANEAHRRAAKPSSSRPHIITLEESYS